MKTTFREIKNCHPHKDGWRKLCNNMLGTDFPEEPDSLDECELTEEQLDTEVSIMKILESNGVEEAYWALRTQEYRDYCLILADVAETVLHIWEEKHPDDNRPRKAIEAVRKWHAGDTTDNELESASTAAADAAADADVADADVADADVAVAASDAASDIAADVASAAASAADADAAAAAAAVAVAYASADYVSYHKQQWEKHEQILRKHLERERTNDEDNKSKASDNKDDKDKQELLIPEECYRLIESDIKPLYHWHSALNNLIDQLLCNPAEGIQDVLLYGLDKYGKKDSWKYIGDAQQRYAGAYHRHMVQIAEHGIESTDPESGLRHSSHALCNAMFLLWFEMQEILH